LVASDPFRATTENLAARNRPERWDRLGREEMRTEPLRKRENEGFERKEKLEQGREVRESERRREPIGRLNRTGIEYLILYIYVE
jgi:hypothetical protein